MKIALDSNAYSDFMRGRKWLDAVQQARKIILPLLVLGELRSGFVQGNRNTRNEADLERFINTPRVEVLLPDASTTRHYAALVAQLRKQGTPIPTNDLWIAALRLQHDLILCTSGEHFRHIPHLARL
jgi:tRNA(fMet)-specific endonuclease VapC